MPRYTFRCRKCGRTVQVEHPFCAPHPAVCPELCGGELVRVFDRPNVVYRGSGFYTTDRHLTPVKPIDYNPDED